MARFRAPSISSSSSEDDSSSSSSDDSPKRVPHPLSPESSNDDDDDDSDMYVPDDENEDRDEEMLEDELTIARRPPRTQPTDAPSYLTTYARTLGVDQDKVLAMQSSFYKPKPPLSRKHSRDSDGAAELPAHRRSFEEPILLPRPAPKYARLAPPPATHSEVIPLRLPIPCPPSDSVFSKYGDVSGVLADAGLAFGRSFRSVWGPRHVLVSPPGLSSHTIHLHLINSASPDSDIIRTRVLKHIMTHCVKARDESNVPCAVPNPEQLTFASIASLFPPNPSDLRDIFKCGEALFDPLVPTPPSPLQIQLKRKKQLSKFLQATLFQTATSFTRGESNAADLAYKLLTTHRITKAAQVALSGGYPRLALLISHAGSTDDAFRFEMREQLKIWREEKGVMEQIEGGVRKTYALLSGDLDDMDKEGVLEDLGEDWKRFFGVLMWFVAPLDASIADVFKMYEELLRESHGSEGYVAPLPSYCQSMDPNEQARTKASQREDGTYVLIKLFSSPFTTLTEVLHPLNFSSSALDYGMPWVLALLLGRVHGIRDFADREQLPTSRLSEDPHNTPVDAAQLGHSPTADLLTASYIAQIETQGDIQSALFVAFFGEAPIGRKRTIKALLSQNAYVLSDDSITRPLITVLGLSGHWIPEAKALYSLSTGSMFSAYINAMDAAAEAWTAEDAKPNLQFAHRIALTHLMPSALLTTQPDLNLLKSLFDPFVPHNYAVLGDDWTKGGSIVLSYVSIMNEMERLSPREQMTTAANEQLGPLSDEASLKRDKDALVRKSQKLLAALSDTIMGRDDGDAGVKTRTELARKRMGDDAVQIVMNLGEGEKDLPKLSVAAPCTEDSVQLDLLRAGAGMRFLRSVGAI